MQNQSMPQTGLRRVRRTILTLAGIAALGLGLGVTSTAHAGSIGIPDNAYDGTFHEDKGALSTINIDSADGGTITDLNVHVTITHGYVGDLTIELRGPDGTTAFLLNRPGYNAALGTGGYEASLTGDTPIYFDDDIPGDPYTDLKDSTWLGYDTDQITEPDNKFRPRADAFSFDEQLAKFDGKEFAGQWQLYVGDSAPQYSGTLDNWGLDATIESTPTVPAPGAGAAGLALLGGLSGLGLLRRRSARPDAGTEH